METVTLALTDLPFWNYSRFLYCQPCSRNKLKTAADSAQFLCRPTAKRVARTSSRVRNRNRLFSRITDRNFRTFPIRKSRNFGFRFRTVTSSANIPVSAKRSRLYWSTDEPGRETSVFVSWICLGLTKAQLFEWKRREGRFPARVGRINDSDREQRLWVCAISFLLAVGIERKSQSAQSEEPQRAETGSSFRNRRHCLNCPITGLCNTILKFFLWLVNFKNATRKFWTLIGRAKLVDSELASRLFLRPNAPRGDCLLLLV